MADLKNVAKQYWQEGCNIVLLKSKEPLHKWGRWQNERQTELSFEALPWQEADGFALIMGQQLHNELYVAAIDFDVKNLPGEIIEKGKQALKFLPVTQMEQTPSGGLHFIFFSRAKPKTVSAYHNKCGLELLGEGKLCIMAPSLGYKRLNDNPPTEVEHIEALFYEALEKAGVKVEKPSQAWFDNPELSGKPYRGKDPPCIQALLKGTREGLRNEYGIRLASYFVNFKGYQPKTVREEILKSWNKLNIPELPWREVDNIIKSAVQGKYVYGCSDPILKSQCDREKCPLAPKQIAKLLTSEERERAERLLADPKLLDYVAKFGRRRLIGEDNTLLTNFVVICSGQTRYPISCILTGFSGSGKNESIRAIKPLVPPEWLFEFTTSTPEAVKYIPEEFAGTLVIYEIAGMESKTGTLGLRSVGEGESIETIFPMRDEETGKMMLGRHKTNARNFITTESDLDIHADLYRRVLKVSLNHSDILTKRVLAKKLRDAMFPEGLRKKLGSDASAKLPYSEKDFQNALRLLDWNVEVVVFPPASLLQLEKLALKKEQKVALRSHIERILNFIRVLAIIFQRQRVIIEDKGDGSKFVVVSAEDFERSMKFLAPSIIETVSRLEKRQSEALELIENSTEEFWDKNKLAQKLGVSTVTAARILKTLANLGYLREIQTTRPYSYELIKDREKPKKLVLLEEINKYKALYEKELKTFLTHILSSYQNLQVRGVSLDLQAKVTETENTPLLGAERQGDRMPVAPNLSLFEQKKPGMLFDFERTSENEISKPTIKIKDSAIPAPSHSDEGGRSDETGKEKMSNDERKSENQISTLIRCDLGFFKLGVDQKQKLYESWISKVEGSRVYFRTGEVLFMCLYCKDKTIYFATEADLQRHIQSLHTGYPETMRGETTIIERRNTARNFSSGFIGTDTRSEKRS
jgi:hypothetical protein